jgi:hypothetical protein
MKPAPHRRKVPYFPTPPPVSRSETTNRSAVQASEHGGNCSAARSVYGRGGDILNLTSNVLLLIALFVITLVLPACDVKPAGNEPNVFDDGDEDETLFV